MHPARPPPVRPRDHGLQAAKTHRRDLWLAGIQGVVQGARFLELVERVWVHQCAALQAHEAE